MPVPEDAQEEAVKKTDEVKQDIAEDAAEQGFVAEDETLLIWDILAIVQKDVLEQKMQPTSTTLTLPSKRDFGWCSHIY